MNTSRSAAPGLTAMELELVAVTPEALKARVILVATLCERLVKVTMPAKAAMFVVPCNVPLPALRAAVTTKLLLLVQKLPNWSCRRRTGCWAKATPAAAVAEGWVWMARVLGAPATSRRAPSLAPVGRPATLAVPLRVRLPLASGVPALGRTRTFCQVRLQVTPLALEAVTVKTNCVLVTEVMATAVPLATSLMLLAELPEPVSRVTETVGAVPPMSKRKPLGALRTMVPVPTLPLAFSE